MMQPKTVFALTLLLQSAAGQSPVSTDATSGFVVDADDNGRKDSEFHDSPFHSSPLAWASHDSELYKVPTAGGFGIQAFHGFDQLFQQTKETLNAKLGFIPHISHEMVEMRDGVKLATIVVRHREVFRSTKKRKTMLVRSPYGPSSDQIADIFMATNDMVAVLQDQRGTFSSEGVFSMWLHDGEDGYDTMEWIAKQPWSNGQVYTSGISADGCGAFTQMIAQPPWLKGQFLMLASATAHETMYPGGAFREGLVEGWMSLMAPFTHGKSLTVTLPDIKNHEALTSYYDNVEATGKYQNVHWPSVHLASWWDIFQQHHLDAWLGYSTESHESIRNNHTIVVTPLGHCTLSVVSPFTSAGESRHLDLVIPEAKGWVNAFGFASEMFNDHLAGPFHSKMKRVNFFVQGPEGDHGAIGNYWTSLNDWPLYEPVRYYLSSDKTLVHQDDKNTLVKEGSVSYIYDPRNPVITRGGNNLVLSFLPGPYGCGSQDQSPIEVERQDKDVISFTLGEALTEPVVITGRLRAVLYVSSNRNDTDFVATLTDVYPDSEGGETVQKSMLVRYGSQRMRWRYNPERIANMEGDEVYRIELDMWSTSYVFNAGHKFRLTITSSNSPYYMVNKNLGKEIVNEEPVPGEDGINAPQQATNNVFCSWKEHASYVELPVVQLRDIPPNHDF